MPDRVLRPAIEGDAQLISSRTRPLLAAAIAGALALAMAPAAPSRADQPVRPIARELKHSVHREHTFVLPIAASHVALHWPGQPEARVSVALSQDGARFGAPEPIEIDEVGAARRNGRTYSTILAVDGVTHVRVLADRPLPEVTLLTLDTRAQPTAGLGFGASAAAVTTQPPVISRAGWGADDSLRFDSQGREIWPRDFHPIQKIVLHHTAGRNGDPNPAATIRAIYYYHAVTQEWGDIGYNFLIDEAGRVYEGRYSRAYPAGTSPSGDDEGGRGVVGGHALAYNAGTVGISLLGTFEDRTPTAAAKAALVRTLSWAAAKHRLNPRGATTYVNPIDGSRRAFANIAAHRDLNATACPGLALYNLLPGIRVQVATEMIERVAGPDRYATAAAVSARFFSPGAPAAFVTNGSNFPDALAGGPAAARLGAPILLSTRDSLPGATASELQRLRPTRIYVLGGPSMVSDAVLTRLQSMAPGGATRVAGPDRYATAAAIVSTFFSNAHAGFVATGVSFPDALAGGPAAASMAAPMLLASPRGLTQPVASEVQRLRPARVVALGGTSVVSDATMAQIRNLLGLR